MAPGYAAAAGRLLEFIRRTETGRTGREAYDVVYGHHQGELPKPVTRMTIAEVIAGGGARAARWGSSAAGAYQFMRATLEGLRAELGLSGRAVMSPDLQDRLAMALLERRGLARFIAGDISLVAFARNLAMEWASLPVLAPTRRGTREVKRGHSYYAGDGRNRALVAPERIEALLAEVMALARTGAPEPEPAVEPARRGRGGIAALIAALVALGAVIAANWSQFVDMVLSLLGGI
jgi:muramidase (phage lysozyme)